MGCLMTKYYWVDPDGGWRYGFPRVVTEDEYYQEDTLVNLGYPKDRVCHYTRTWEATEQEYLDDRA